MCYCISDCVSCDAQAVWFFPFSSNFRAINVNPKLKNDHCTKFEPLIIYRNLNIYEKTWTLRSEFLTLWAPKSRPELLILLSSLRMAIISNINS